MTASAVDDGSRVTAQASDSWPMLASTSSVQSRVRISPSRVMSQAAPQTRARGSESSKVESEEIAVASDLSSSRILA